MTTTTVVTSTGNTVIVEDLQQQVIVGGYLGPQGVQGVQGYPGIPGDFAGQGVQGYQGPQGLQGVQGLQGRQGVQGTQGLQGLQGLQGTQGLAITWRGPYSTTFIYKKNDTVFYNGSAFIAISDVPFQNESPELAFGTTNVLYWNRLVQGSQGIQGLQGLTGGLGPQGTGGFGPQGTQGLIGPIGYRTGLNFQWSTSVNPTDPGTGRVRFNNSDLLQVTEVYFDRVDYQLLDQEAWYESFNQGTGAIKGNLYFQPLNSLSNAIAIFEVTGAQDQGDWYKVDVAYVSGAWHAGIVALNDIVTSVFVPAGIQGTQGIQGRIGKSLSWAGQYNFAASYELNQSVSYNGNSYVAIADVPAGEAPELQPGQLNTSFWSLANSQGIQGLQGLQGPQGTQGIQGRQGVQGLQGIQGNRGFRAGILYRFQIGNDLTQAPEPGRFKFNISPVNPGDGSSRANQITQIAIHPFSFEGIDVTGWIGNFTQNPAHPVAGQLVIQPDTNVFTASINNPALLTNDYLIFNVTGFTQEIEYDQFNNAVIFYKINVQYVAGKADNFIAGSTNGAVCSLFYANTGAQGVQGRQGTQGIQGLQGVQGQTGGFGGASFDYTFDNATLNSSPLSGNLRLNNASLASATQMYISKQQDGPFSIEQFLYTISLSTSTIKGHFRIGLKNNPSAFVMYSIDSIVDSATYYTVNCTYLSATGASFVNGDDIIITFARTGDKGDQGIQGLQGTQGIQGVQGLLGPGLRWRGAYVFTQYYQRDDVVYFNGNSFICIYNGIFQEEAPEFSPGVLNSTYWDRLTAQGMQGTQGIQGIQGMQGLQGEQGLQGIQGLQGPQGVQGFGFVWRNAWSASVTYYVNQVVNYAGHVWVNQLDGNLGLEPDQPGSNWSLMVAQGTQGTQGTQGPQGLQGLQGIQGIQGIQGLDGISHNQGLQGIQGIQGPQGVQGPIGVNYRGDYTASAFYDLNDVVFYLGDSYIATYPTAFSEQAPIAEVGGLLVLNTTYWNRVTKATQGIQGVRGPIGITWRGNWNADTYYVVNDVVNFDGVSYISTDDNNLANRPDQAPANWGVLTSRGYQGIQGFEGIQGLIGLTGQEGPQGEQGIQGIQGMHGQFVAQGIQGPQGIAFNWRGSFDYFATYNKNDAVTYGGTAWVSLDNNNTANTPSALTDYVWGVISTQGVQGVQGVQGLSGLYAAQGIQGPQGPQGTQGFDGIQGLKGEGFVYRGEYSQFYIGYVKDDVVYYRGKAFICMSTTPFQEEAPEISDGVVNTAFWSLLVDRGVQGFTGLQGLRGLQGDQGIQGVQGVQGVQGFSILWKGNWSETTNYKINDVVYYNGNSYIAIFPDSNVAPYGVFYGQVPEYPGGFINGLYWQRMTAQGVQGRQGIQGLDGISHNQGLQGIQGIQGPQGPQGLHGMFAGQGVQGPQGRQGTQGLLGIQGIQGIQGIVGIGFEWRGEWFPQNQYEQYDVVNYKGSWYVSQNTYISNTLNNPEIISSNGIIDFDTPINTNITVGDPFYVIGINTGSGVLDDYQETGTVYYVAGFGVATTSTGHPIPGRSRIVLAKNAQRTMGVSSIPGTPTGSGLQNIPGVQRIPGTATGPITFTTPTYVPEVHNDENYTLDVTYRLWDRAVSQGVQGLQGLQGPQGLQGGTGGIGVQGNQGVQGTRGFQGLQGIQGDTGIQGVQGTRGLQGPQGLHGLYAGQGIQGIQGRQGPQGTTIQGIRGFQGLQGYTGSQGTFGTQGAQGRQGTQGVRGMYDAQGIQGLRGPQGIQGPFGAQGRPGPQGIIGIQGIQGIQGNPGVQGLHGQFAGQGVQGRQGIQGMQGRQGTQGGLGRQGPQGTSGIQGIFGVQGGQGPQGLDGAYAAQGIRGYQGVQGGPGYQGTQGTRGFQGIQGLGSQGIQGASGTAAFQGSPGIQGPAGTAGSPGVPGTAGAPGAQGAQGIAGQFAGQGVQGTQGFAGTVGEPGQRGTQGVQGLTGAFAAQGIQGTQGLQGPPGEGTQGIAGAYAAQGVQGTQGVQGPPGAGAQGASGTAVFQGAQGTQGVQGIQGSVGKGIIWTGDYNSNRIYAAGEAVYYQGGSFIAIFPIEFQNESPLIPGTTAVNVLYWNSLASATQGVQGVQGRQGVQGLRGDYAAQGIQGPQGTSVQGAQGAQGLAGAFAGQGIQGIQGQAIQGLAGNNGTQGAQGMRGFQGIPGVDLANVAQSIVPSANEVFNLGSPTRRWRDLYLSGNTIDLGGAQLGSDPDTGSVLLPSGTTIGGINPGTINIKGSKNSPADLPTVNVLPGDSYLVQGYLWVWSTTNWVNIGKIEGPQGIKGLQGIQGPGGVQGDLGPLGVQGIQGLDGAFAAQGIQGVQGNLGVQGTQGLRGEYAAQGIQGVQGQPGIQGNLGPQGVQGLDGAYAAQGVQGVQGGPGTQGRAGIQGTTGGIGVQGNIGVQGFSGPPGPLGLQGVQGAQGNPGVQGNLGPQGVQGLDGAYAAQGIQGQQGVQGGPGTQGVQGLRGEYAAQGVQGQQGVQGSLGYQGVQGLHGEFAGQGVQGIQGDYGIQGIQGALGPIGLTGIQGRTGSQGIFGAIGEQGAQGTTGTQGTTGQQGVQGVQGFGYSQLQGTQGVQGQQGNTGVQGASGTQGSAGYIGSDGAQGTQGTTGGLGVQGIQGFAGNPGANGSQGVQGIGGYIGADGAQGIQGRQGVQGTTGIGFVIAKVYTSINNLVTDANPTGISAGQFAIIDSGDPNNPENSKIFLWNGSSYQYINDLSGTAGIQGIAGSAGTNGAQGAQGAQGLTGQGVGFTVVSYATYTFTANGSTTTYPITSGITVDTILVNLNGITQTPTTNYTVSGSNLVFPSAPPANTIIQVRVLGGLIGPQGVQGASGGGISTLQSVSSDILPSANEAYDIGSQTLRWRDLYLSGNTINLAGVKISAADGGIEFKDANNNSAPLKTSGIQVVSNGNIVTLVASAQGLVASGPSGSATLVQGVQGLTGIQGLAGSASVNLANYAYTADGTTTTYAAQADITVNGIVVTINGIVQAPTTSYTVSGSNVIFASAPTSGDLIHIRVLGGFAGATGAQGIQGVQGISIQGVQGLQGPQSLQGLQGLQGLSGIQGIQGQGFTGTLPQGDLVGTTDNQTLSNKLLGNNIRETVAINAIAATGTINYDLLSQQSLYYTTNATGNFAINFRGNSTTTLSSLLNVGDSITAIFINTNGTTSYYNTSVQIDGTTSGVTLKWQELVPTTGSVSAIDTYGYTIVKTGASTYTVFAGVSKFV